MDGWATDEGDGTVPAASGIPVEMSDRVPIALRQQLRHGPIGGLPAAVDRVETFEGRCKITLEGDVYPAVLGLTVEAGEDMEVTARVAGTDTSPADAPVYLTLTTAEPPAGSPGSWSGWTGTHLRDVSAGRSGPPWPACTASPSAPTSSPQGGALSSRETIEAIGGDDDVD